MRHALYVRVIRSDAYSYGGRIIRMSTPVRERDGVDLAVNPLGEGIGIRIPGVSDNARVSGERAMKMVKMLPIIG